MILPFFQKLEFLGSYSPYMYTSDRKNALNLAAEAKLSLVDIVFCPLFVNVIKNNITSLVIHIIVCLLKTE